LISQSAALLSAERRTDEGDDSARQNFRSKFRADDILRESTIATQLFVQFDQLTDTH